MEEEAHKPIFGGPQDAHSSQAGHLDYINIESYPGKLVSLWTQEGLAGAYSKLALTHRHKETLHGFCGFSSQRQKKKKRFRWFRKQTVWMLHCFHQLICWRSADTKTQQSQMRVDPLIHSLSASPWSAPKGNQSPFPEVYSWRTCLHQAVNTFLLIVLFF